MSKLIVFDFRCPSCDKTFERLIKSEVKAVPCPFCEALAERAISPPHFDIRMGVDGSMPTMTDKWERMHRQRAKLEEGS